MHQLDPVFVFVSKCKNTYVVYRYYVERKQSRCERSWMNDAGSISSAPVGLTDLWILRCTRNALCIAYAKCNSRGINRGRCIRRHTERHCQNSNSNNSNDGLSVMAAWTCSAHGTCVPCSEKKPAVHRRSHWPLCINSADDCNHQCTRRKRLSLVARAFHKNWRSFILGVQRACCMRKTYNDRWHGTCCTHSHTVAITDSSNTDGWTFWPV